MEHFAGLDVSVKDTKRCGDEMMRTMLYEAAQAHDALEEMVMAQGLGDADRQAPRDEKGDRRAGAAVGCDHAPHRRHRVPLDSGTSHSNSMTTLQDQIR